MSCDTTLPPFAPMVQVISGRAQGFAGDVSDSLSQLVQGLLQVVEFFPFLPSLPPFEVGFIAIDGLKS
jgi:hypothetical protein